MTPAEFTDYINRREKRRPAPRGLNLVGKPVGILCWRRYRGLLLVRNGYPNIQFQGDLQVLAVYGDGSIKPIGAIPLLPQFGRFMMPFCSDYLANFNLSEVYRMLEEAGLGAPVLGDLHHGLVQEASKAYVGFGVQWEPSEAPPPQRGEMTPAQFTDYINRPEARAKVEATVPLEIEGLIGVVMWRKFETSRWDPTRLRFSGWLHVHGVYASGLYGASIQPLALIKGLPVQGGAFGRRLMNGTVVADEVPEFATEVFRLLAEKAMESGKALVISPIHRGLSGVRKIAFNGFGIIGDHAN